MTLFRFNAFTGAHGAALGLWLSSAPADAAMTHTTANLNLRGGPSMHYHVKSVIPAGARIDIHSCGHTWCYMGWAGHTGYVHSDYLRHHVTVVVMPLVVHVQEHTHAHNRHYSP